MLHGIVLDQETRKPIEDAIVTVRCGSETYTATTDAEGTFQFDAISAGICQVTLERLGYASAGSRTIQIEPGKTVEIQLVLKAVPYREKGITVIESRLPPEAEYGRNQTFVNTRIAGGNTWQGGLATIPGVQLNAFGQIHTRGEHQLVSFLVDDLQLPITPEGEIGYFIYPNFLSEMDIETGSYDPSVMGQVGVAINLVPVQAHQTSEFLVSPSYGDHDQHGVYGYWVGRSEDNAWNYFAGLQSNHTDLRLEAPNPVEQTLNNAGTDSSGFIHASHVALHDTVKFDYGRELGSFGVADTPIASAAGVVQNEDSANTFALISWTHSFSDNLKMNIGGAWVSSIQSVVNNGIFTLFTAANPLTMPNSAAAGLPANPENPGSPYLPTLERNNSQALLNLTLSAAISEENILEVGTKLNFIATRNLYDILDAGGAGTLPVPHVKFDNTYHAFNGILFVTDHCHPSPNWHVDIGTNLDRFDNGAGLVTQQLNPSINAAYALSKNQALRFSFNHLFDTPPISPDLTGALSASPEKANDYEISYEMHNPKWNFQIGPYLKDFRDQLDGSLLLPFSNLPIFVPTNFQRSLDQGFEVSASTDYPSGLNGFLSYSLSFAQSGSPGASSTSLDNPLYLDHDQRDTLDFGVSYSLPTGFYASADSKYGSGFPQDAAAIYNLDGITPFGINGRVPSFVANLNLGWKNESSPWGASLRVFNLFNSNAPITVLSDFTGTRFTKERSLIFQFSYHT